MKARRKGLNMDFAAEDQMEGWAGLSMVLYYARWRCAGTISSGFKHGSAFSCGGFVFLLLFFAIRASGWRILAFRHPGYAYTSSCCKLLLCMRDGKRHYGRWGVWHGQCGFLDTLLTLSAFDLLRSAIQF